MVTGYSIEVTNNVGKVYRFQPAECPNASYSMNSKLFKVPLPDAPAEDAIVINLGREKSISAPFKFLLGTVDASNGTAVAPVLTIQEKVDYWLDVMITDGLEDLYTVSINSTVSNITDITCLIDSFSLDFSNVKPNSLPGNVAFSVGGAKQ